MNEAVKKGRQIIQTLHDHGYQAFFVGGFVRDYLLDITANDIDITTDALPQDVQSLFAKTKATGKRYGTMTVLMGKDTFEVTTFRSDHDYTNHRKPSRVSFSKDLDEDLKRRDFSINAMAMTKNGEIIDRYHGKDDLNKKLIRAIGEPEQRFHEDALRILRAFRFVSKLNFDIEPKTFDAIKQTMPLLKKIANERILSELKQIIHYPHFHKALRLLDGSGFGEVFKALEPGLEIISKSAENELNYLEFFALCFYLNDMEIPDDWRFSNKEKAIITKLMELVSVTENDQFNVLMIYRLGPEIPLMANRINRWLNQSVDQADLIKKIYHDLPIKKTCDLAFKGQDILELTTLKNAEIIGEIIDLITYEVITGQLENNYEDIKQFTLHLLETTYEKR